MHNSTDNKSYKVGNLERCHNQKTIPSVKNWLGETYGTKYSSVFCKILRNFIHQEYRKPIQLWKFDLNKICIIYKHMNPCYSYGKSVIGSLNGPTDI